MASAIFLLFIAFAQVTATAPAPSAVLQPQPDVPVALTLRLTADRHQFRPGEIIPIELEFSSAMPKRFTVDGATYDRSGRLAIDEFKIDRIDDVSDPMLDYFGSIGGSIGGGLRGIGVLGEKPFTVKLELNEWFRFDKPGMYTLAVKSRRTTDESVTPHAVPWGMPVRCLATGTTNSQGDLHLMQAVDTGDLPASYDANYPTGAKIWLVVSADVDCVAERMTAWRPALYLFESRLITFRDTGN